MSEGESAASLGAAWLIHVDRLTKVSNSEELFTFIIIIFVKAMLVAMLSKSLRTRVI